MLPISLLPFHNITTERMELTRLTMADLHDLFELRSNDVVRRYSTRHKPKDLKEIEDLINKIETNFEKGEVINWRMALKEKPEKLIGSITIWNIDKANHRGEMGYMLHEDYMCRGLMTEAMAPVLDYGLNILKLHTLMAYVDSRNDPSKRLLLHYGFEKNGHLREETYHEGVFYDTEIYTYINPTH